MAIGIENYPNIVPADADYLNGDIKDTPSGTPVNRLVYGDIHQFFRKLMRDAGLTPNGLRDNESNGFQYLDDLYKAGKPYNAYTVQLNQSGTSDPTVVTLFKNELSGAISWTRTGVGSYVGTLVGEFLVGTIFTLTSNSNLFTAELMKCDRIDDDNVGLVVTDSSGIVTDDWTANIEIRIYR